MDAVHNVTAALITPQSVSYDVLMQLLSKVLSYAVFTGALVTKLPQIVSVYRKKSAYGISPLASELGVIALFVYGAYGVVFALPFRTFGETVIVLAESLFFLGLLYKYNQVSKWRVAFVVSLIAAATCCLIAGFITKTMIKALYEANNFVVTASRLSQITANIRQGGTGHLNLLTYSIYVGSGIIRVFTTLQEGIGMTVLRGHLLGLFLNATMVSQILYYNAGSSKKAKLA